MTSDDEFFASGHLVIRRVDWEYAGFLLQRGRLSDDDPTLPEAAL
ncbi:MAG: hypothetical protein U0Q15_08815 [Kineosporiaceae bacterium]